MSLVSRCPVRKGDILKKTSKQTNKQNPLHQVSYHWNKIHKELKFPGNPQEYTRKGKAEACYLPEEELASQEGISHSSSKLFNLIAGETTDSDDSVMDHTLTVLNSYAYMLLCSQQLKKGAVSSGYGHMPKYTKRLGIVSIVCKHMGCIWSKYLSFVFSLFFIAT